jgi:hypothetical protein
MCQSSASSHTVSPGDTEPVDGDLLNTVVQNSRDGFLESFDVLGEVRRLRVEKVTRLQPYLADISTLTLKGQPLFSELSIAVRTLLDSRLLSGELLEDMVYFSSKLEFLVLVFEQMGTTFSSSGEREGLNSKDTDTFPQQQDEAFADCTSRTRNMVGQTGTGTRTWDQDRDVAYVLRLDREHRLSLQQHYVVMVLSLMRPQELYEWFLCVDHGVLKNDPRRHPQSCIQSAYALSDETSELALNDIPI